MTVRSLGELSPAALVPSLPSIASASLSLQIAELQGRLGQVQANLQLIGGVGVPNPAALVAAASQLVALAGQLTTTLPVASANVAVTLNGDLASLGAKLGALNALQAQLTAILSGGAIAGYVFDGRANDVSELTPYLQGDGLGELKVLALKAASPAARASLTAVFPVTL